MDIDMTDIQAIARAKEEVRRRQAILPFEQKIRILVEMQRRRAPIVKLRGKIQRVWQIEEPGSEGEAP